MRKLIIIISITISFLVFAGNTMAAFQLNKNIEGNYLKAASWDEKGKDKDKEKVHDKKNDKLKDNHPDLNNGWGNNTPLSFPVN